MVAVERGTVELLVAPELHHLGRVAAAVVESLAGAVPVENLAPVPGHVLIPGIERHHDLLLSDTTWNGMPSETSRRLVMGRYSRPR